MNISHQLLKNLFFGTAITGFGLLCSLLIPRLEFEYAAILGILPIVFLIVMSIIIKPIRGYWFLLTWAFFLGGISRAVEFPVGVISDLMLVLLIVAIFLNKNSEFIHWENLRNWFFGLIVIWFLYTFLLLFHPEAPTYIGWLYAIRQISLHFLFLGFICLILVDSKHIETYLIIWFVLSILTTLNGFRQQMFFLPSEIEWLEAGAKKQHILWGKLRVFSNMFDAGQFGPAQGHVFVTGAILALHTKVFKKRVFYGLAGLLGFIGMMISGTRGSLAVPLFGFLAYFIISKNWKVLSIGFVVLMGAFIFLKYTSIGSNVYAIHRMRTAVNPTEDASFSVRLMNQRLLYEYMKTKPFGAGVGTTDNVGKLFNPDYFAAQIPTDSYFVKIWVQTGFVGVGIILVIIFYVLFRGGAIIWKIKDEELRHKLIALYSPLLGIFVASYGNNVLPQLPTNFVVFISIAFIFASERYIRNQNKALNDGQESYQR